MVWVPTASAPTAGMTVPPGREKATSIVPAGATVVPFIAAPTLTPVSTRNGTGGAGGTAPTRATAAVPPGGDAAGWTTSVVACVPRRASPAAMTTATARARW